MNKDSEFAKVFSTKQFSQDVPDRSAVSGRRNRRDKVGGEGIGKETESLGPVVKNHKERAREPGGSALDPVEFPGGELSARRGLRRYN